MDMDLIERDDVDLFDAITFPLLDDDLLLNFKYSESKNSDSEIDSVNDDWSDIVHEVTISILIFINFICIHIFMHHKHLNVSYFYLLTGPFQYRCGVFNPTAVWKCFFPIHQLNSITNNEL